MVTFFEGQKRLIEIINNLPPNTDMNEAQTRFHLIDKILFECLGWGDDDVEIEKSENRKFTDYELGKPRLAILEAKREGYYFEIPAGLSKKQLIDLKSLILISQDTKDAIEQAREYCGQRGVPIAIVSNGHQFIIFLASRQDGISILEGNAIVFRSLNDLKEKFNLVWQLISAAGLKERNIYRYLTYGESGIPNKLSAKVKNYPSVRYPSELQATLRQLSELFIQDAAENDKIEESFFHECYCDSGALSKYALLSKNILEARYASLFPSNEPMPFPVPVREKKGDNLSPDIFADAVARRPIVLLGDVGVGKTSFVKNLKYNSAYDAFKNAIYIYIDLGSKAALSSDLKDFVLDEITEQLREHYNIDVHTRSLIKGVYAAEIHRFSQGIWGDKKEIEPQLYETKLFEMLFSLTEKKDQHLKKTIAAYSKSSKKQVIICLDNADQRNYEMQQNTFIISQELAKDWSAIVFVSVRPQTFFKSKRSGALAAYPHKIFTISPPRIDSVIEKRLLFALNMAEGKVPVEIHDYVIVNSRSLAIFLKVLVTSLNENNDLYEFLSNITGGNIRSAIGIVLGFIGSPNVDAEKIIKTYEHDGRYIIPLHEFSKAALLGDYSHYSTDNSLAMNVFDVSTADIKEHFLVTILTSFLISKDSEKDNDGFCKLDSITEELQSRGFTSEQINNALRRTTNKKLIETTQRITFEEDANGFLIGEMPDAFRITSIGAYHLQRWIGTFTYLDAMVFDTPIFDKSVSISIGQKIDSFSIEDRYFRASEFKNYLLDCWSSFSNKPKYLEFAELLRDSKFTFDKVNQAITKNKSNENNEKS